MDMFKKYQEQNDIDIGDYVVVKMFDYNNTMKPYEIQLQGLIVDKVPDYDGYNINLYESHIFVGIIPLPTVSTKLTHINGACILNKIFIRRWMIVNHCKKSLLNNPQITISTSQVLPQVTMPIIPIPTQVTMSIPQNIPIKSSQLIPQVVTPILPLVTTSISQNIPASPPQIGAPIPQVSTQSTKPSPQMITQVSQQMVAQNTSLTSNQITQTVNNTKQILKRSTVSEPRLNNTDIKPNIIHEPKSMSICDEVLNKLRQFVGNIVFRSVFSVISVPEEKPCYIKCYNNNGTITIHDSDEELIKNIVPEEISKRIVYKYQHFYGFTIKDHYFDINDKWTDQQLHFTDNRYCNIDLFEGCKWGIVERGHAIQPTRNNIICGTVSQIHTSKPPSFDKWFVVSSQFMFLWQLIMNINVSETPTDEEIIQRLIIPENPNNFYIRYEIPASRYIYAAIYLLLIKKVNKLPEEWNLSKRFDSKQNDFKSFESWWINRILYQNVK